MAKNTGGNIINICSLSSYVGIPCTVPYTSSKSGMLGMTRALAVEWVQLNICVNGIAPGYLDEFYQSKAWQSTMLSIIPMRPFGVTGDLAGLAVFLASDASTFITGQCIPVDGGYLTTI
jgi:NAD(P)-dependent dehydrogenase (short-subunit alcohol dehydrogenase family)